ncbi:hypothetical protein K3X48_01575 [Aliiroseovarius crassostreae]|uniref:Uncharacterized protein n=1 Tax=Aliiroseovarius crassostreae TaxID=154981 RepID=A0A9Q9H8W3_9RHOB|nr:hypothetical protein [Aliiroseovarius crassostreae]UWP95724.1 hypothetical protein K3X48_01575 [Aliiroseovarius crassostreae]
MIDEKLKVWSSKYWWLRGVLFALSFTALVTSVLDWEKYELLSGIHAIIVAWNFLTGSIANSVKLHIPFVPLNGNIISALVVLFSLTIPSLVLEFAPNQSAMYKLRFVAYSFFIIAAMLLWGAHIFDSYTNPVVALLMLTPLTVPQLTKILGKSSSYAKGIASVIVALFTFEALFILSGPSFKKKVVGFICEYTPENGLNCKTDTSN